MIKKTCFLVFAIAIAACSSPTDSSPTSSSNAPSKNSLPKSTGGSLDIIVIAKESLWQSKAGDAFRKHFIAAQRGLPQPEAVFNVQQIEPHQFNSLLQRSRNIVIIEKDPTYKAESTLETNVWSKPQLVVRYKGSTPEEIAEQVNKNHKEIFEKLKKHEVKTLQARLRKGGFQPNPDILEKHNVSMNIPKSFELEQRNDDLLVFWNKTIKTDQGILIHFQPLNDNIASVGTNTIPMRDSITKLYIHGQKEGSYMTTEMLLPPAISQTELSGAFAIETRGLWKTVNDFMGGPFINYTIYDEKNNQIIFLDAFIYSPETKKRKFVLELEATLKSIKIL